MQGKPENNRGIRNNVSIKLAVIRCRQWTGNKYYLIISIPYLEILMALIISDLYVCITVFCSVLFVADIYT